MDSQTIQADRRPIGFWLKLVDRLIDESFETMLSAQGFTRRHWQVLNILPRGGTIDEIDEQLRPFLDGSEPTTQPIVDDLVNEGWAAVDQSRITLTPAGERMLSTLQAEVTTLRRELVLGIAPEEYQTTLSVLERMARNLGWSEPG